MNSTVRDALFTQIIQQQCELVDLCTDLMSVISVNFFVITVNVDTT